jgi:uncharacterized zinc-type alcohol dehydrogenase-like protein
MLETKSSMAELSTASLPAKGYAAQSASAELAPWNFERRPVGHHDVLIGIKYCGVCHSDIHFVKNDWGFSLYPMVPGHEIVGMITAVGDHVKKFKEGDTVGVGCLVDSCRVCDNCNEGLQQYCLNGATFTYSGIEKETGAITQGGYSNRVVVNEDFVCRVSDKLPLNEVAPLLCAGITTYSPLRRWNIGKGHKVGIVGLGGLGHMAVKFAASFGAEVTMLSTSPAKEADAKKLGAHHFVLTTDEEKLQKLAGNFHFIIDTVSAPHDYNLYLGMLKTKGTLICVGLPPTPAQIAMLSIVFQGRSIAGSLIGGIPETQEMLDYCAEHNITSDVEMIGIAEINHAYERMERSDVKYRFVIDMTTL